ncbi:MAG: nitrogen fixation negative regulator NifL, partial [Methylococcaceae bacterium]|nr:nitrogen fixation negative regulator NifL [Methylococcaceae bacterium]
KYGHRYLADLTIAPMLNEQGTITHYIGMHRDITQSYESEKKVINQKLLIESVINSSPIAMVVIDDQDKVILDNHNYKALVSDLDKGEPATFFLQLLRHEMGDLWQQIQSNEQGFNNREFRIEGKGNRRPRWFSCAGNWFMENAVNANAFFDHAAKQYLILTITDITKQRRQMEELHLQTLKTIMSEDERVRSIRETLLGAMHQIQMPMNQIRAAEQILKHKRDDQHVGLLQSLQQIQQSGEEAITTMQKCIPEILQTAVIPVNLNQILHDVLLLSDQRILSEGIDVHWQPLSELPHMLGSENRLRILFKQLIDNAIDAVSKSNSGEQRFKITTDADADLVYVCIEDNGPGIPVEKRAKVFEPFYTTRPMGGNQAGMGLVMAKEIVNQHQGFIDIDPAYDQGCRFKISFPLHRQESGRLS